MARTMRRCEAHGSDWYRDWCVMTEMARREGHRVVDLDPCRMVERVLSAPGELIDPATIDYEAAEVPHLDTLAMIASKMLRITHEEAMEREDIKEAARIVARASVDAALGLGVE